METIIAQAITSFLINAFTKGAEELGKNVSADIYNKVKRIFKKDDHRGINLLDNLRNEPHSRPLQQELNIEISGLLLQSDSLSRELVQVLTVMDANTVFLETMFNAYKKLKYDYTLAYIRWTVSTTDTEEECLKEIRKIENKMLSLTERIGELLQKQHI